MKRLILLSLLLVTLPAMAWKWWPLPMDKGDLASDTIGYSVTLSAVASSGEFAPFWMHSNQQGRVSTAPYSGSLQAVIEKRGTRPGRWWDYDFAMDLSGMAYSNLPGNEKAQALRRFPSIQGRNAAMQINRLYAHVRLYIIDITAGVEQLPGCNPEVDPELSSGDLLFSGNAPAMPRISIGIDRYTAVPGLFGYLEVRGGLTHAWITDNVFVEGAKLHYKYIGGRAGGDWPVNVSYELHHVVQWGGYSPEYGDLGNDWNAYKTVFFGKAGGTMFNDQKNALGNHLTSQLWSLIVKGDGWRVSGSWQNLIEDNFIFIGAGKNLPDGIFSLRAEQSHWPYIQSIELQYVGTSDQSGPYHDQDGIVFSGNDSYYRNGIYRNGWNYQYRTIGTPFILSPLYNRDGWIDTRCNRSKIYHIGIRGDIRGFRYRTLLSHTRNYYLYDSGKDYFAEESRNLAWMVEVHRHVPQAWGLDFGIRVAGDIGNQFGNTGGVMISIRKQGVIWRSRE